MTNRLDRGERAVLLIGGVSLLTAVVCFGILESTGTFKNPVYSIGGSLVGFLAAATLLYRIYLGAEQSQIPASERRKAPFVFEEVVKVLDLRTSGKLVPGVGQEVALTDYYRVTKESDEPEIKFHYSTTGQRIEGKCITHPLSSKWMEKTAAGLGEEVHLKHEYEMEVNLSNLGRGQSDTVINSLKYIGAFEGEPKEWLHTHIEKPTGRLAMVLIFSDDRPCKDIIGKTKTGRDPFEEVASNPPAILEGGKIVYWSIERPSSGNQFQLEWEWAPKGPITPTTTL